MLTSLCLVHMPVGTVNQGLHGVASLAAAMPDDMAQPISSLPILAEKLSADSV